MSRNGRIVAVVVLLTWGAFTPVLAAKQNINTQTFSPNINGKGLAVTESGGILRHLAFTAWFVANYAYKPVVLYDENGSEAQTLVRHRLMGNALFAIGLVNWIELGLDLPISIYQKGSQIDDTSRSLRKTFLLGDLRLAAKVKLLDPDRFP